MSSNWLVLSFAVYVLDFCLILDWLITGSPALLLVASNEGDIFFIDPYKPHENLARYYAVPLPAHKIHSIDLLWVANVTYLFWSDHNAKALYSIVIDNPFKKSNRPTREVNIAKKIVSYRLFFYLIYNI